VYSQTEPHIDQVPDASQRQYTRRCAQKRNNRSAQVYSRQTLRPGRKDKRRPRLPSSFQLVKERPGTPGLIRGKQKTARQSRRPVPPLVRRWLSARSTSAAGADEPGYRATIPGRQQPCSVPELFFSRSPRALRCAVSLPPQESREARGQVSTLSSPAPAPR